MTCNAAIAILLFSLPLAADEAKTTPAADFTPGFERLVALGLPALEGAQWIASDSGARETDYELRQILEGVKGNGWKVQHEGKPAFLPLGALEARELPAETGGGGLLGGLFGGGSKKVKTLPLDKDAATLIAFLGDPEKSKEFREDLEYRGAASLGTLLIFSAQLHQTGHLEHAKALASAVFSLGMNPEAVIDASIDRIATRDLGLITDAFFTNRDWAAYERDLKALSDRYPRGWESFPAVQMILPAVAKRVAGTLPPKPEIAGIALHPEALTALDATLEDAKSAPEDDAVARYAEENGIPAKSLTPDMRRQIARMLARGDVESSEGPWLIEQAPDGKSKDPWSQLKRLGLEALPALAAVANDDTLTFSRNASPDRSYSYGNRESAAEKALRAYKSMDRPLTRGELACRLLAASLPGEDHDESGPQTLADTAVEIWKTHRGKSRLELLLVFLAEGNSSQVRIAGDTLAKMPDPAAHQAFEKHILESDDLTGSLDSVANYLILRKAAAKDFFTRFSTALKSQLDGVDPEEMRGGYEIKRAGGVDKFLKKLSLLVGGESPRKLVLELAKAEKPDKQQIGSLAETLMESSPDKFISIYLEAAVKATHLPTRAAFLSMLSRQGYMRQARGEEPPPDSPVPPAQVEHWTALLADDRLLPDGFPVSQHAAGAIEQLHSPASAQQSGNIYQLDPNGYPALVLARAKDRLAGKNPVPLPEAAKVSASRLEEMLKHLADAKPEKVHDLSQQWTIEEKLAFQKWRAEPENAAKLPASVIAARKLLTTPVEIPGNLPVARVAEIMRTLKLEPGLVIDFDTITKLATSLASEPKAHSGLSLGLMETPLRTGMVFTGDRAFDTNLNSPNGYSRHFLSQAESSIGNSEADAAISVTCSSPNARWVTLIWTHDDSKIVPPDTAMLEKFRESMTALEQPDANPVSIYLCVLHRDDLGKLAKLNSSESSDE